MNLPIPTRPIRRSEIVIDTFAGFNNTENANQEEFSFIKNMSNKKFPSLVPRPSRELMGTIVNPNGILSFKGSLYTVSGTSFRKDGVQKGTVTNGKKCMIEFNQYILIFPDKRFYDTVNDTYGNFNNGTQNTEANPAIDKATVHNNRVFGMKGDQIYASKQGDFKEWNVFEQLLTDSWATDVAGAVDFKTIGTYQNHVVLQSEKNMFELYGYNPSNFQIQETIKIGSNVFSYAELDSVLYFANRDGIYAYAGGVPRRISQNIDMPFESAELGQDGRYLYASVSDGVNRHLFVFDSESRIITREDDLDVIQFALHQNHMIALCSDGKMYRFNSGNEVIEWAFETIEFRDDPFSKKGIKRLELHAEMQPLSRISVYIKGDVDTSYEHVQSFFADANRMLMLPVLISKNTYKIRVEGVGGVKINSIKRILTRGGRL